MKKNIQKIYDKKVDCGCNNHNEFCKGNCICYCHIPIWYRNLVWKIQDTKLIGNILIVFFMMLFQPFISTYLVFFGKIKEDQINNENN